MNEPISAVCNVKLKEKDREELKALQEQFIASGGKIYHAEIGERVDYKPESPQSMAQAGKVLHKDKQSEIKMTLADVLSKHGI